LPSFTHPFLQDSRQTFIPYGGICYLDWDYENEYDEESNTLQFSCSLKNYNNTIGKFIENTGLGNRSNQLVKYALLLVDMGADIGDVEDKVKSLNNKMADKLTDKEIEATILITASKAIVKRDNP
jgi:hypothetical protein